MNKGDFLHKRLIVFLLSAVLILAGLSSCEPIKEIKDVAVETITQELPTAEETLTTLLEINRAMDEAMSRGEEELTFYAADIGENELRNIADNLSTFWGKPVKYSINKEFLGLEGIIPGRTVDVRNITNYFELSSNFYVFDYIRNGNPIPEDKIHAKQIAGLLPGIAEEILNDPYASEYDKTLAVHDWLVATIDYDETIPAISEENGSFGAIVLGRTMCQGYAEALELILKCYTDIEILQIVGEALNYENEPQVSHDTDNPDNAENPENADNKGNTENTGNIENAEGSANAEGTGNAENADNAEGNTEESEPVGEEPAAPTETPSSGWGGHAWNAVKLDGDWYQIDTTFNDPRGNPAGQVSHFYFGQTDEVMSKNHRWAEGYFPVSDTENFLFFRKSGLFAVGWDAFQTMFTEILTEYPITTMEFAIQGAKIDEDNIQFIYQLRRDIEEIRWSEQIWKDICVNSIELIYS